jgi:hypothetical protein
MDRQTTADDNNRQQSTATNNNRQQSTATNNNRQQFTATSSSDAAADDWNGDRSNWLGKICGIFLRLGEIRRRRKNHATHYLSTRQKQKLIRAERYWRQWLLYRSLTRLENFIAQEAPSFALVNEAAILRRRIEALVPPVKPDQKIGGRVQAGDPGDRDGCRKGSTPAAG